MLKLNRRGWMFVIVLGLSGSVQSADLPTAGSAFRDCPDCPEMVVIPAGSFVMGSPDSEPGRYAAEGPQHRVTIPQAFALGKTAVTQGQWRAIVGSNPSHFANCGDDCPVERVTWNGARYFIFRLNAKTGKTYRLPSEAEWEYACRAGGHQLYCGSDDSNAVAWNSRNSGESTHAVATKRANAWGLYDMNGNVWQWVEDCWHGSYLGAPTDGTAWASRQCEERVLRGGSWLSEPLYDRSAKRVRDSGLFPDSEFGFRVARTLP
jgi:formylglycine-generating enzyme required for sulfatase activity